MADAKDVNIQDAMVSVELKDGKIRLYTYLSNYSNDDLDAVMLDWIESENEVCLLMNFTPASPVDYLIEGHEMPAHNNHIDIDAKPVFDALRAELLAQVARIDAIVFAKG